MLCKQCRWPCAHVSLGPAGLHNYILIRLLSKEQPMVLKALVVPLSDSEVNRQSDGFCVPQPLTLNRSNIHKSIRLRMIYMI